MTHISLEKLLDLQTLRPKLPQEPKVLDIQWLPIVDHAGEDSYEITVIIPDDTPKENLERKLTRAIETKIREELRDAGIAEFAYLRTLRPADLREEQEYADEEFSGDSAVADR